ncbi:flagellar basal-body MS-ring/collar protein FliF [Caldibacillus lycopersici]|uniref:Flagellar M-ring protein n=2 Tax=Perspicuibacillus lycopersici TaxID=1325689 RepID=A0AAE3IQ21_9BACI|nr:flagellar basal-body MS-ring/collar protein FliF [Perspicuibacillus lycopersici]MCU9612107.1 flagellar basal-body MS-ring/collar protein FliF [Perspicuibacillus lycopersici]
MKVQQLLQKINTSWREKNRRQKGLLIGSILFFIVFLIVLVFLTTRSTMVPLYSNLTPSETGSIKEALDTRGVKSEIVDGGTTIKVPKEMVDTLLVELAAEGIPESGSIDYSFFSQNAGLGTTDNEFNVMKLDAMQTELSNLIKSIDGIQDANVMINLPEKGIFVQDSTEEATASIVLTTEPAYQFNEGQIKSLYTLVSKSIPNLPTDNIVIMNQNFEYFDLENGENFSSGSQFESQYAIKKEVEKDLQRQVQNMLGTLMGQDKVLVSVTADIDFTQETREENLVEPVDEENMEGLTISAQRLTESYTGTDAAGGVPEAEDGNDSLGTSYVEGTDGNGNYNKTEETINNEVNRIRKEIVESPYKIRDIGIQVVAEPPDPENPNSVSPEIEEGIQQILNTIIRTSIDKDENAEALTDEEINNKIAVTFQPLLGKVQTTNPSTIMENGIPLWVYFVGGGLVVLIFILLALLFKRKKNNRELEEIVVDEKIEEVSVPDLNDEQETEESIRKKQVERMAKEQPEEFAKLIRTWLSQE